VACLGKMHDATGGYIRSNEQIAKRILEARDLGAEAADHVERALGK
jgi:hypothetical protein